MSCPTWRAVCFFSSFVLSVSAWWLQRGRQQWPSVAGGGNSGLLGQRASGVLRGGGGGRCRTGKWRGQTWVLAFCHWDTCCGQEAARATFWDPIALVAPVGLLWLRLCAAPPKMHIGILTLKISECDLIWNLILYRRNQVKMRSLGQALIQQGWHLYKDTDPHVQDGDDVTRQTEDRHLHGEERGMEQICLCRSQKEPILPTA